MPWFRHLLSTVLLSAALLADPVGAVAVTGTVTDGNAADVGAQVVMFDPDPAQTLLVDTPRTPDLRVIFEGRRVVPFTPPRAISTRVITTGAYPDDVLQQETLAPRRGILSYLVLFAPNAYIRQGRPDLSIGGTLRFPRQILGYMHERKVLANPAWAVRDGLDYTGIEGLDPLDQFAFAGNDASFFLRTRSGAPSALRVVTAVPEPASWAMLIVGFGLAGAVMRRQRATA